MILKLISEKSIGHACRVHIYDAEHVADGLAVDGLHESRSHGFAGFLKLSDLVFHLKQYLNPKKSNPYPIATQEKNILSALRKSYARCKKMLKHTGVLHVYIFPSNDTFVRQKMLGTSGYTPYKNCLHIYISTLSSVREMVIEETFAHEYAHTLSLNKHPWDTLEDTLVFEGLAEAFRVASVGNGVDVMKIKNISKQTYAKSLMYIKKHKGSTSKKVNDVLFFEGKEFPKWTGYRVGYKAVTDYCVKQHLSIKQVFSIKPGVIIAEQIKKSGHE